jgi:hypothetical protein
LKESPYILRVSEALGGSSDLQCSCIRVHYWMDDGSSVVCQNSTGQSRLRGAQTGQNCVDATGSVFCCLSESELENATVGMQVRSGATGVYIGA